MELSFAINYQFLRVDEVINVVLDLLFLVDNVLMFFTTFENRHGEEIWDHYDIFKEYSRTWRFVFDSLSLLGLTFFKAIHPAFKYF